MSTTRSFLTRYAPFFGATLAFALFVGGTQLYASWTAAPASPPNNNVDAPLNVGSDPQTKYGPLTLENLVNSNWIRFDSSSGGHSVAYIRTENNRQATINLTEEGNHGFKLSYDAGINRLEIRPRLYGAVANPTETLYMMRSNGNVGIGDPNPSHKLSVNGALQTTERLHIGYVDPGNDDEVTIYDTRNNGAMVNIQESDPGQYATLELRENVNHGFRLRYNPDTNNLEFRAVQNRLTEPSSEGFFMRRNNGYVGLGQHNPSERLDVRGDVRAEGFQNVSDARLKEYVTTAPGLSAVEQLRGVSFTWKESGQRDYGLIAQEVEEVFPELVSEGNDQFKSVDYVKLTAVLIESIKEQQAQIQAQQAQIRQLEERLDTILD